MSRDRETIRTLYIDDSERESLVQRFGARLDDLFSVEWVEGGDEALRVLGTEEFDCIVSRHALPETNGLDLLERLRSRGIDVPFVLYAEDGSESLAGEAIAAGVDGYLPGSALEADTFERRIRRVVSASRSVGDISRREQLERILQTIPVSILQTDERGSIVFVNRRARDMLEITLPDVEGRTCIDAPWNVRDLDGGLVPEEDRLFQRIQRTGATLRDEQYVFEWSDGRRALVSAHGAPLFDEEGKLEGTIVVLIDITEHWRHRRQLEDQNERLDAFAGVIGHDLRTPLHTAGMQLQLARLECDSRHLEALERALEQMNERVEDVLMLAREERVGEDDAERIDLVEEVERRARALQREYDGIDLNLELEPASRVLRADECRLRRLLDNLIRNAVEHAATDEVTIRIGTLEEGFYLEDDGRGLTDDERRRISSETQRVRDPELGLGLSIVKRIVDAHGWNVRAVEGEEGGSRFEFIGVTTA